jgi:telomerase reverse transcriptase
MFFDTRHNSERAVHANVHAAFAETAAKMWAHARCLPRSRRPAAPLVVDTIRQTVAVAAGTLAGKTREAKYPGYRCAVGRLQVEW